MLVAESDAGPGLGRVLLVDDEPMVLESLAMVLDAEYHVHTASSAHEARRVMQASAVDVVISDQRMPVETGTSLLSGIRQQWPDTYRILLTGYTDAEAMAAAINDAGVWHFLRKPWDNNEVRNLVQRAIEARHAKRLLAESRARYAELFQTAPVGLARIRESGEVVACNDALRRLADQDVASMPDLLGAEAWAGILSELHDHGRIHGMDLLVAGVPVQATASLLVRTGRPPQIQMAFADQRPALMAREASGALARAQSLSALPMFVAGAIHDFKNQLGAVRMNADLLAETLPAGSEAAACATDIVAAAEQAVSLSHELLDVGRLDADARQSAAPAAVIARVDRMFRRALPRGTHLDAHATDCGAVEVALGPRALHHALVNLIMNALDALPESGGRITVTGRRSSRDAVALSVADTGEGMSAAVLERAMEPFFTTKAKAGTGIGLSTVRSLVEQVGGHMDIASTEGVGTTVTLSLPVVVPPDEAPTKPVGTRTGIRVAVVEAPAMQSALVRLAVEHGFMAWSCDDPDAAWGMGADVVLVDSRKLPEPTTVDALVVLHGTPTELREVARLSKPVEPAELRAVLDQLVDPSE